jgi:hypothetical protein
MDQDLNKLRQSYIFIFIIQVISIRILASQLINVTTLMLLINIIITFTIYFYLTSYETRIILLVFLSFGIPQVAFPFFADKTVISDILSPITIYGDRFKVGVVTFSIFSFLLIIEGITIAIRRGKAKIAFSLIGFIILLLLIIISHDYSKYSIYHVILDFFYILGCLAIILFFFLKKRDFTNLYFLFKKLFKIYVAIVFIDILLSLTTIIPWANSYRGGIQGVFHAYEITFSVAILFLSVYLINLNKNFIYRFLIFLIMLYILQMTNIKSAVGALIIVYVLFGREEIFKYFSTKLFVVLLALIVFLGFDFIMINNTSLAGRVGTYIVYINSLIDGNLITGIMPGVSQVYMRTNLAVEVFQTDYTTYLDSFSEFNPIAYELIIRSYFTESDKGAFLPHNTFLILISAYGILFLPILRYIYFSYIFIVEEKYYDKKYNLLFGLFISCIIISFTHGYLLFIEIIFFGELLYALANVRKVNQFT